MLRVSSQANLADPIQPLPLSPLTTECQTCLFDVLSYLLLGGERVIVYMQYFIGWLTVLICRGIWKVERF